MSGFKFDREGARVGVQLSERAVEEGRVFGTLIEQVREVALQVNADNFTKATEAFIQGAEGMQKKVGEIEVNGEGFKTLYQRLDETLNN
jgi:hypothetical protein